MKLDRTYRKDVTSFAAAFGLVFGFAGSVLAADFGGMKDPPMEPPMSEWEFSANVALTTDYIFRGASQTDEGPAIQGGFDVGYKAFYAGVWASNLDFGGATTPAGELVDIADIEIDWYFGLKKSLNGVSFDIGAIYYSYPNAYDKGAELDYWELKLALGGKIATMDAGFTFYWSPDYTGQIGDTYTFEGSLEKSLNHGFALSGTLGYITNGDNNAILADGSTEYWYWNAGVSKTFKEKFKFDVRYWDTDGGSACGSATVFQCDARVVGTLSASF